MRTIIFGRLSSVVNGFAASLRASFGRSLTFNQDPGHGVGASLLGQPAQLVTSSRHVYPPNRVAPDPPSQGPKD